MAHFAELDSNNKVLRVIVVSNDDCEGGNFPESEASGAAFCNKLLGGIWKQTSYNKNFRTSFAAVGGTYNPELDRFIDPKPPFDSWVLNDSGDWEPPVAMPDDGKPYQWDEDTQGWVAVEAPE